MTSNSPLSTLHFPLPELIAGAAKIEITPSESVWMDGMIREHKSEGVHDPLHARAVYLSSDHDPANGAVIASVDVCAIRAEDALAVRREIEARTGVPSGQIIIAATHTHSGPATIGFFNAAEEGYLAELRAKLAGVIGKAVRTARPAVAGCASGLEGTISHYRRLLADDGHVVMNWEPWPEDRIVRVLGEPDPEVGVMVVAGRDDPARAIAVVFNHAGHPNVMSGENYLLSADYPGYACAKIEEALGGIAMFVNGAQGSVDIDGLKDRDWEGVARAGGALADAVIETAARADPSDDATLCGSSARYQLDPRRITQAELDWAEQVLARTGGKVESHADGVGDDYKAALYKRLAAAGSPIEVEQMCLAIGDTALVSFPGELFTEIGMRIKAESPFARTYIIGLANGCIGYVPTREAISQGGYEVDTRRAADESADVVVEQSLALLRIVSTSSC